MCSSNRPRVNNGSEITNKVLYVPTGCTKTLIRINNLHQIHRSAAMFPKKFVTSRAFDERDPPTSPPSHITRPTNPPIPVPVSTSALQKDPIDLKEYTIVLGGRGKRRTRIDSDRFLNDHALSMQEVYDCLQRLMRDEKIEDFLAYVPESERENLLEDSISVVIHACPG